MKALGISALLAIPLLVLLQGVSRAEEIDNPDYTRWAKFGVGSSETLANRSKPADADVIIDDTTQTLIEKTDDYIVVKSTETQVVDGKTVVLETHSRKIAARVDKSPHDGKPSGTEKIDAAGKQLDCTIVVFDRTKPGGNPATIKTWNCTDIPGGMVKLESNSDAGTVSALLKSYVVK